MFNNSTSSGSSNYVDYVGVAVKISTPSASKPDAPLGFEFYVPKPTSTDERGVVTLNTKAPYFKNAEGYFPKWSTETTPFNLLTDEAGKAKLTKSIKGRLVGIKANVIDSNKIPGSTKKYLFSSVTVSLLSKDDDGIPVVFDIRITGKTYHTGLLAIESIGRKYGFDNAPLVQLSLNSMTKKDEKGIERTNYYLNVSVFNPQSDKFESVKWKDSWDIVVDYDEVIEKRIAKDERGAPKKDAKGKIIEEEVTKRKSKRAFKTISETEPTIETPFDDSESIEWWFSDHFSELRTADEWKQIKRKALAQSVGKTLDAPTTTNQSFTNNRAETSQDESDDYIVNEDDLPF